MNDYYVEETTVDDFYASYARAVRRHNDKAYSSFSERLEEEASMVSFDHWCGQVDVAERRGKETFNALRNNFAIHWAVLLAVHDINGGAA